MVLHLVNLIKDRLGAEHAACISARFLDSKGERVLLVECRPSPRPVFVKQDQNELFYVRLLAATTELSARQAPQYITTRFRGSGA